MADETKLKISVITATWQSEASIQHAQNSIAGQNYPRDQLEWIVVDGASTDRTVDRIRESAFQPDILVSEPDNGIYDALNKGVRLATGDVIAFLHADDFFAAPDVLKRIGEVFDRTGAEAVYGDLEYVRPQEDGRYDVVRYWKSGAFDRNNLKWGWMPPHPSLYVKASVYERAVDSQGAFFDTSLTCAADYDFMLRILWSLNVVPEYLDDVFVKMCVGGVSNRSLKHILTKSKEDWSVIRRNNVGHVHTLLWKNVGKLNQFFRRA